MAKILQIYCWVILIWATSCFWSSCFLSLIMSKRSHQSVRMSILVGMFASRLWWVSVRPSGRWCGWDVAVSVIRRWSRVRRRSWVDCRRVARTTAWVTAATSTLWRRRWLVGDLVSRGRQRRARCSASALLQQASSLRPAVKTCLTSNQLTTLTGKSSARSPRRSSCILNVLVALAINSWTARPGQLIITLSRGTTLRQLPSWRKPLIDCCVYARGEAGFATICCRCCLKPTRLGPACSTANSDMTRHDHMFRHDQAQCTDSSVR